MTEEESLSAKTASLHEHLAELRTRLMITVAAFLLAFVGCYLFAEEIYGFLVKPLAAMYAPGSGRRLIYTGLTEAFMTYLKVSFFAAVFVSFPVAASQLYMFLAPGLYKKEKKILLPFIAATPVLFLAGAALAYYFVFPLAWSFFLSFEQMGNNGSLPIELEARVSEYLSLVLNLIIAFGVAFQLPILLTLLARVGIVSAESLAKRRKYALVLVLLVAAILTPPDVISQIGLALPMMLLYECSIKICRYMERKDA